MDENMQPAIRFETPAGKQMQVDWGQMHGETVLYKLALQIN